ncbi:MAG: ribonuclease E/G, partial [Pseudomonadota bacterium]
RDRNRLLRAYKIQEVIKRRQIMLVQVVKEERGNKGAAVTTYLSLAGRYGVLMPNTARGGGISRKITSQGDRKRLKKSMAELDIAPNMGLIIRTAGAKRTKTEIKRDYDYLLRLWETIRERTLESVAPCLIYEEASLIKRAIRDLYDKDTGEILVQGEEGYREAKDFMKMLMPSHAKHVQPYKGDLPIFLKHKVEQQLDQMYQPVVQLKSGGYLVIQQTEALVSIDVNSGKATKERNVEATALKTNSEAAQEVARQCRLRDLAGLIVIDFIDMEENRNNRTVEKKFKEAMKNDRARTQIGNISGFGLMEMSRQRRRSGIVDGTTQTCPVCDGAGAVRSHEVAAVRILRAAEGLAAQGKSGLVTVKTSTDVALFILNTKRAWLERLETTYGVKTNILADSSKFADQYEVSGSGSPSNAMTLRDTVGDETPVDTADPTDSPSDDSDSDNALDEETSTEDKPKRRRRRRRRRG